MVSKVVLLSLFTDSDSGAEWWEGSEAVYCQIQPISVEHCDM